MNPISFFIVVVLVLAGVGAAAVSPLLGFPFALAAFVVSLVSERKTGQVRAAMMRMCPPRMDRKASDRG